MTARFLFLVTLALAAVGGPATGSFSELQAGQTYTIPFPALPPTFYALEQKKPFPTQMTIYLPTNYERGKTFPLFIFLNGGDGGGGGNPGVARALTEGKDFICVNLPLFRAPDSKPGEPGGLVIMGPADGKYMWPYFQTMLATLDAIVPNIDPAHQVLGGFSNGAHATASLLDGSDGAVARRFSAIIFVEGGGKLQHYDLLQGKPFLMLSSNAKSQPRAEEITAAARAAGAVATFHLQDVGGHDFPQAAYPAVRAWLRDAALK